MTEVADTSKQSYRKLDQVKEMSQCDRIHEALKKSDKALTVNELNNTALADLDIPNGRVSARINKLVDEGKVVEADKREDVFTERQAKTWTDLVGDSSSTENDKSENQDGKPVKDGGKSGRGEPSNGFVSMSEANTNDGESTEGLFVDDKQSDKPKAGDVIYE